MGTYATTTALDTIMIGVNFDTATSSLATKMITHAENEINKYLSKRYDISGATFQTAASIPPLVTSLCERLSEGYMWKAISRGSKESLARGKDLIDDVTSNLKLISDYKLDLLNTAGSALDDMSNTAYRVLCNTTSYTNTFDEDDELSWSTDPDKLEDIADGRD
jgi:hypothetical protein